MSIVLHGCICAGAVRIEDMILRLDFYGFCKFVAGRPVSMRRNHSSPRSTNIASSKFFSAKALLPSAFKASAISVIVGRWFE